VQDGAPADGVLQSGDVILSYDGKPIDESRDLPRRVGATQAGEVAELTVLRDGGEKTLTLTVGRLDATTPASAGTSGAEAQSHALDATVAPITPRTRRELGLAPNVTGVVVTSLKSGGHAMRAGIRVGDVISKVGDRMVTQTGDIETAMNEGHAGALLVQVVRDGVQLFIGVPIA
jgi:serine protease Do